MKFIKKFKDKLENYRDELVALTILEMGKPNTQALDDFYWELNFIEYYIKEAENSLRDKIILQNQDESFRMTFEPHGVCAVISPWNFPLD